MELRKYKLGEIAEIYNGSTPSTKEFDNYDGNIVWATPKDLSDQNSKYFYQGARNITQKGFDSCSTQLIPANNILMSSRAPIGLFAINKVDCCTNQGFKNIVLDKKIADVNFMYYFLKYHVKEIEALGSGTTFKEVSKTSFEKYEISIPSLNNQQKIAAVLSALDDKIALNRRMNAKLEQMAKQLYDHWFVQFDFPYADGKPYKASGGKMVWNETLKRKIPAGWEVKKLGEVLNLLKDGTHNPPKRIENGIALLTGTMFGDNFIDYSKATYISEEDYKTIHSTYEPQEGDIIITKIGTIGNVNFLRKNDLPLAIHCNSALLRFPSNIGSFFGFYFCKSDLFKQRMKAVKGQSIQEFVSLNRIESILVEIPSNEIVTLFTTKVTPILNQQAKLQQESIKLGEMRDKLLPLLMNGQVEVK